MGFAIDEELQEILDSVKYEEFGEGIPKPRSTRLYRIAARVRYQIRIRGNR